MRRSRRPDDAHASGQTAERKIADRVPGDSGRLPVRTFAAGRREGVGTAGSNSRRVVRIYSANSDWIISTASIF